MPYIQEENRKLLDEYIEVIVKKIIEINHNQVSYEPPEKITDYEFINICENINYCFSRILGRLIGGTSYPKIAMITGVLENIKQEFYRRIAEKYENDKIVVNGDIPEYKRRSW